MPPRLPLPIAATPIPYVLRDGLEILLRPVCADDAARLRAGFEQLSEKTRHHRFFRSIASLSEQDVSYFTQVDQSDHVAWCAVDATRIGQPGLGMGRFVRMAAEPTVAEFALVVIDAYQHRGVGYLLLALLLLLAEPLGLDGLRGVVLVENEPMLRWMRALGAHLIREDGVVAHFELPVGQPVPAFPNTLQAVRLEEAKCDLRAMRAAAPAGVVAGPGGLR